MNNQQTLTGFEPAHKSEQSAYQEILPQLQAAAKEIGANADILSLKPAKTYSSIYYGNTLVFRLKLRGKIFYIEVSNVFKNLFSEKIPADQQKISGDFLRINLESSPVSDFVPELVSVLKETINTLPKEWDCCSRYLECSNAKQCIHPDPAFALGCGYRKILASGRIFYGENRNID